MFSFGHKCTRCKCVKYILRSPLNSTSRSRIHWSKRNRSLVPRKKNRTYVYSKESGHVEVAVEGVQTDGERRCGYVPQGSHGGQGEQTNASKGEHGTECGLGVKIQGGPGAAPRVNTTHTKHSGVDTGTHVKHEPVLVGIQKVVESVLGEIEDE